MLSLHPLQRPRRGNQDAATPCGSQSVQPGADCSPLPRARRALGEDASLLERTLAVPKRRASSF